MFSISRLVRCLAPGCASAVILAGLVAPSSGQALYGAPDDTLSPADFGRMHVAASHLYEHRDLGAVERWRGSDSKDSGSVELLRTFRTRGMACSRLRYQIHFAGGARSTQTYLINWCKSVGGEWKIEDHTPPA